LVFLIDTALEMKRGKLAFVQFSRSKKIIIEEENWIGNKFHCNGSAPV
jgi:hypothetical protein